MGSGVPRPTIGSWEKHPSNRSMWTRYEYVPRPDGTKHVGVMRARVRRRGKSGYEWEVWWYEDQKRGATGQEKTHQAAKSQADRKIRELLSEFYPEPPLVLQQDIGQWQEMTEAMFKGSWERRDGANKQRALVQPMGPSGMHWWVVYCSDGRFYDSSLADLPTVEEAKHGADQAVAEMLEAERLEKLRPLLEAAAALDRALEG